eukprot:TRINITY_DN21824_c0_g1_i3.p1 TRINITY_DN21824_c0_g1~~TRINITY_DN21824_c0_g1_i3.p1  ORF type:complete len:185 (-),score=30.82 TRINITY_DN21824_c0_g1_i3:40-594(-)
MFENAVSHKGDQTQIISQQIFNFFNCDNYSCIESRAVINNENLQQNINCIDEKGISSYDEAGSDYFDQRNSINGREVEKIKDKQQQLQKEIKQVSVSDDRNKNGVICDVDRGVKLDIVSLIGESKTRKKQLGGFSVGKILYGIGSEEWKKSKYWGSHKNIEFSQIVDTAAKLLQQMNIKDEGCQ